MPNGMAYNYFYPFMDDYMSLYAIQSPRSLRLWTWEDSQKMVDFYRNHCEKVSKYGLDLMYPLKETITKEELQAREDRLTDYFVHEMRKQPVGTWKVI